MEDEKIAAAIEEDEEEEIEEEIEEWVEEEIEEEIVEEEVEEADEDEEAEESEEKRVVDTDGTSDELKHSDPDIVTDSPSSGKIFVGGISRETTEDTFAKYFRKYGKITDSVIMKDKHTQLARGFGFVTFSNPSVIDKVLADDHVIDGRTVEVKRTVPKEDKTSKGGVKTKKIFVGGIPPSLTEDELKEHFSTYGTVVEHFIMLDHGTGRSRGFGFVVFEDEDTVEKIISKGKMHDLGGKQVEIKKAEPKKPAGDPGFKGRGATTAHDSRHVMAGGGSSSMYGYGYGGAAAGYGMGYGYGGPAGYGMGYAPNFGGPYGGGYGAGNGYGGPAAGYGSSAYGRGPGGRYHPYGR